MLKVREDRLDEYKRHHEAVWPEMLEALSRNGWHNYSLFMAGDGLMFGYFEADGRPIPGWGEVADGAWVFSASARFP